MKIFKYKFTKFMTAAIYIGIALAVAAAGVNTYFVIAEGITSAVNPVYPILQYTLMYLVSVLLFIILISLLVSSYYSIDGKTLTTSFGIIKSKYEISKITDVVLDRNTNKLTVHFGENNFFVIVVKEAWYEEFIQAILKANPKISYTVNSKENKPDKDDKNKG